MAGSLYIFAKDAQYHARTTYAYVKNNTSEVSSARKKR